uniref:Uncharacterized protein n=1 Tax=Sinocyclocheilus anshuiensis TaxID=1608454 RepID=A0A671SEA0_9TELE
MEKHCASWTLLLAGRQMSKLSDKKLCADSECSLLSFKCCISAYITLLTFYSKIQGSYYGDQEARLGYLPSSVVEETHALMPAEVEPAEVFE